LELSTIGRTLKTAKLETGKKFFLLQIPDNVSKSHRELVIDLGVRVVSGRCHYLASRNDDYFTRSVGVRPKRDDQFYVALYHKVCHHSFANCSLHTKDVTAVLACTVGRWYLFVIIDIVHIASLAVWSMVRMLAFGWQTFPDLRLIYGW